MFMRRCSLLLLLVCVCSCGLFSHGLTAHASDGNEIVIDEIDTLEADSSVSLLNLEEDEIVGGEVEVNYNHKIGSNSWVGVYADDFNNGVSHKTNYETSMSNITGTTSVRSVIGFSYIADNKKLFSKGDVINLGISRLVDYFELVSSGQKFTHNTNFDAIEIRLTCADGTIKYLTPGYTATNHGDNYSIMFNEFEIPADTYGINIHFWSDVGNYPGLANYAGTSTMVKKWDGFYNTMITLTYGDKTQGLLNGIIQWLTNIRDNIVNLPSKIRDSLSGLFDIVKNAIVDLGNTLLDGIKNLFIPDDEFITDYYDGMNEMLSSKLGAIYQVGDIISDFGERLQEHGEKNTISVPVVNLNLAGSTFTFGGWDIALLDGSFTFILDALKLVIDIAVTCMFINVMRKKYDKLIEG